MAEDVPVHDLKHAEAHVGMYRLQDVGLRTFQDQLVIDMMGHKYWGFHC